MAKARIKPLMSSYRMDLRCQGDAPVDRRSQANGTFHKRRSINRKASRDYFTYILNTISKQRYQCLGQVETTCGVNSFCNCCF